MTDYMMALKADIHFRNALEKIKEKSRPIVPAYSLCDTVEAREALLEKIKFETGRQDGFDLLFRLLTGESQTKSTKE